MVEPIIETAVILAVGIYSYRRIFRIHRQGMLAASATGALWDLGLDVKKLPPHAKAKFFGEADALSTATKGRFHPKRLAMRFFGWYCVENPRFDPSAFRSDGALSASIGIMRA